MSGFTPNSGGHPRHRCDHPSLCVASGTPKDRFQMLRRAFRETLKDKDFLAEAIKSKLDVEPVSGEEVEKIVAALFKFDSATVAKMSEILK
jgi:hypothetical protein